MFYPLPAIALLDNALDAARSLEVEDMPYTTLTADLCLLDAVDDIDQSGLLVELERRNEIAANWAKRL